MPRAAIAATTVDHILLLEEIGPYLCQDNRGGENDCQCSRVPVAERPENLIEPRRYEEYVSL
jgi:hypothetical protein